MIFEGSTISIMIVALCTMQAEIVLAGNVSTVTSTASLVSEKSKKNIDSVTDAANSTSISPTILFESNITTVEETTSTDFVPTTTNYETSAVIVEVDTRKDFDYIIFNDETGVPCTLTNMGITLTIPYKTKNETILTSTLEVPLNASVTGSCEETISIITIIWEEPLYVTKSISDGSNSVTLRMKNNGDIYYVEYVVVSLFLDDINFPNATESVITGNSSEDLKLFSTSVDAGMHNCNETYEVNADPIILRLENVLLIAFNNQSDLSSKKEEPCLSSNKTSQNKVNVGVITGGVIGALLCLGLVLFTIRLSTRNKNSWNLLRNSKILQTK